MGAERTGAVTGIDRWGRSDEPAWARAGTDEWAPASPGERYPGHLVDEPSTNRPGAPPSAASGRASVRPPAPPPTADRPHIEPLVPLASSADYRTVRDRSTSWRGPTDEFAAGQGPWPDQRSQRAPGPEAGRSNDGTASPTPGRGGHSSVRQGSAARWSPRPEDARPDGRGRRPAVPADDAQRALSDIRDGGSDGRPPARTNRGGAGRIGAPSRSQDGPPAGYRSAPTWPPPASPTSPTPADRDDPEPRRPGRPVRPVPPIARLRLDFRPEPGTAARAPHDAHAQAPVSAPPGTTAPNPTAQAAPVSVPPAPARPAPESPVSAAPVSPPPESAPRTPDASPVSAPPTDETEQASAVPADDALDAATTSSDDGTDTAGPETTPAPDRPDEPAPPSAEARAGSGASDPDPAAPPDLADPEQVLSAYTWRLSPETLRELADDPEELRALRDRLTEKVGRAGDNASRARLLSLRAVVSRILGDLGKAHADARLALAHAEATGELRRIAIAQARLATVLHWRGDFAEADRLFAEANSPDLPDRLRATLHEHAGRSCYDQGRYIEACDHFWKALDLCRVDDPDLIARTALALDGVLAQVVAGGWGPYARSQDEIRQVHRPPVPKLNESFRRWGYVDADGNAVIAPTYAHVQAFSDGAAWVRRPNQPAWELIDEAGKVLIEASAGYRTVRPFSDGLTWVRRDGAAPWSAIDRSNRTVVPPGYDDVRPFRRGVAAARRGRWGAVDKAGRVVVPTRYDGFATTLVDGRSHDGFSDEGLAVVVAGGGRGVVDRTGRVIVSPTHTAVVIHPVAFLVADGAGRWGALDRRGKPLIDVVHPKRTDVIDQIDRLLSDTRPLL